MPSHTHATLATRSLEAVIQECDFLTLSSSTQQYPNSKGAGLPLICVQTALCNAVIALQGAHLLEFKTTKGKPLLWVSPNCNFTAGTALRGGVPVCLPWFGPHEHDNKKPKHGFARNQNWQLSSASLLPDGSAQLKFTLLSAANDLFEFDFCAELMMTLGHSAKLELCISNTDTQAFECSWALHSYHPVSSLSDVRVKGLEGKSYLDVSDHYAEKILLAEINFSTEVDRAFYNIDNSLKILGSPSINITHHNCPSVIVWNPGEKNAAKIADIGVGNEQKYICVERGAVLAEKWTLLAGENKRAWVEFSEA